MSACPSPPDVSECQGIACCPDSPFSVICEPEQEPPTAPLCVECPPVNGCQEGAFSEVFEAVDSNFASFLLGVAYAPCSQRVFYGGQGSVVVFDACNPGAAAQFVNLPLSINPTVGQSQGTEGLVYNPNDNKVYVATDDLELLTIDADTLAVALARNLLLDGFLAEAFSGTSCLFMDVARNHLWMTGFVGPVGFTAQDWGYVVYDCATQAVIHKETLLHDPLRATGASFVKGLHCGSNDAVYLFLRQSAGGNVWKVNPDTFVKTLLPLGVVVEDNLDVLWVPEKNEIYFGAALTYGTATWAVLNPATDTLAFAPSSAQKIGPWGAFAYHPVLDRVLLVHTNGGAGTSRDQGVAIIDPASHLLLENVLGIRVLGTGAANNLGSDLHEFSYLSALYIPAAGGRIWVGSNPGTLADPGIIWALSNCLFRSTRQCSTAVCAAGPDAGHTASVCKDPSYRTSVFSQGVADLTAIAAAHTEAAAQLRCDPAWVCPNSPEPTGGDNISADTAADAPGGGSYTLLGPIGVTECDADDWSVGANQTIIFTAPDFWHFKPGVGSVDYMLAGDITAASVVVTATTVTVTLSLSGTTHIDHFTIRDLQIQPTIGGFAPLAGFILCLSDNPGTLVANNIFQDLTTFGECNTVAGAPFALDIVTQPSATAAHGVAFAQQPQGQTLDRFGNVCDADTTTLVTVKQVDGTGILNGTTEVVAIGGQVYFTGLSYSSAQTIHLRFSAPGLVGVNSNAIVVS